MARKTIFISYRRDDVPSAATSLRKLLADEFGREIVFKDEDSIEPGDDFQAVIDEWLGNCAVLIAVIGKDWLTAQDDKGRLRLNNRFDPVRSEIEEALDRDDILVIPVIIPPAERLSADDLPRTLKDLVKRQMLEVRTGDDDYARDVKRLINKVSAHLEIVDPKPPPEQELPSSAEHAAASAEDASVPHAYLDKLKKDAGYIDILGLDTQEVVPNGLPKIYVPAITQAVNVDPEKERSSSGQRFDLVLHSLGKESLYLTGDPGSGKTTFCQWVTYVTTHNAIPSTAVTPPDELTESLPEGLSSRIPLWIRLRDFWRHLSLTQGSSNWQAKQLENTISVWLDGPASPGLPSACFRDQLAKGTLLLLIDGVDEVPEENTHEGTLTYPRTNLLSGLANALGSWRQLGNRVLVTSRPYGLMRSDRARLGLPDAHLAPLTGQLQRLFVERWYHATDPERWQSFSDGLTEQIGDRRELTELKQNPLLLTALCVKFREGKRLPQDVYQLYDSVINTVLYNRFRSSDDERSRVRWRLGAIALGMHYGIGSDAPRPAPLASVHRDELDCILGDYMQRNSVTEGGSTDVLACRSELLTRSGLLLPRAENMAEFFHQDFRDFLAAERWSRSGSDFKKALQNHAANRNWRRMLQFLFAKRITECSGVDQPLRELNDIAESLAAESTFDAATAILVADCLEISAGKTAGAGLGGDWSKLFYAICHISLTRAPKAADRNALFLALGRLGWDTRKGVGLKSDNMPDIDWLPVPNPDQPKFYISKYLVTNAQFQAFLDTDYDDPQWWRDIASRKGPTDPSTWTDPNAPRTDVDWFQAIAYARWLESQNRPPIPDGVVSLPTFSEWKMAYFDEANEQHPGPRKSARDSYANLRATSLRRTSSVGIFPSGAGTSGALDMAGNVAEWCITKRGLRGAEAIDDSQEERIVLGGHWARYGRIQAPMFGIGGYYPLERIEIVGFRVVCRPPHSTYR